MTGIPADGPFLKRWCYLGILHPELFFGCAVIHLGYLAGSFIYGFDRKQKTMTEHASVFPPMGQVRFDPHPEQGITAYRGLWGRLRLTHDKKGRSRHLEACFPGSGRKLKADVLIREPEGGLSLACFPMTMADGRAAFTAKAAGLTAEGRITAAGKQFDLSPDNSRVLYDWTSGYYPRHTFWNWACGAGRLPDGSAAGFNFSSGVYENGQMENTVWINGKPEPAGEMSFLYDPAFLDRPWTVESRDGRIHMRFFPEVRRSGQDDLYFVKSRFVQLCGTFDGFITARDGSCLSFFGIDGAVEEHAVKW